MGAQGTSYRPALPSSQSGVRRSRCLHSDQARKDHTRRRHLCTMQYAAVTAVTAVSAAEVMAAEATVPEMEWERPWSWTASAQLAR
jgi:hypothetical protein